MTLIVTATEAPTPTTFIVRRDLPALPSISLTETFTTPAISVPPSSNNPYIVREHNPSGTVFIAVGAIVGAILIAFILYHLIRSVSASRLAKKTLASEKLMYETYNHNNNTAYGNNITPSPLTFNMNTEYQLVAKLPLLAHNPSRSFMGMGAGSQAGDTSTIYASEAGHATSKHDLTKMFISPTAEVMGHKRVKSSQYNGSVTNLSLLGGSTSNLASPVPASNRHSQMMPSLYINNEVNNSDYSLATDTPSQQAPRSTRKTIPSMYLDDLIDEHE